MKKRIAAVLTVMAITAAACLTYAATGGVKVFDNHIRTSDVQVQVQQLCETSSGLKEITDGSACMPGETCSYIPRVTVKGSASYVRLRFQAETNKGGKPEISARDVYGLNDRWVLKGSWFYCLDVIKRGESSDVFEGIRVPQAGQDSGFTGFRTTVTADAIQAENFTPDFERDDPWGPVTIQASAADGSAVSRTVSAADRHVMKINRDGAIVSDSEDLFAGFGDILPGDIRTDSMTIRNDSGKKAELLFRTDNQSSELLGKVSLKLQCSGRTVYDGPLVSDTLKRPVSIACIEPGGSVEFVYTLGFPEDSDNRYQDLGRQTRWIFETKLAGSDERGAAVRTGDAGWIKMIAALALCGAMILMLVIIALKRGKNEKNG
ncbi:MAG: hypothetical protein Q4A65_04540 [Bacillota bacterium]|nr:hypothetical protein [Bacillota bacterium]